MPRMAAGLCRGARGAQVMDSLDDLGGDQAALLELLAAVNHAVADGVDLGNALNDLALAGGHLLDDLGEMPRCGWGRWRAWWPCGRWPRG